MVRVRWPSGAETTIIPAPGTLTVLASSGDRCAEAGRPERRREEGRSEDEAAKKATTSKKGATDKSTGAKRSSR